MGTHEEDDNFELDEDVSSASKRSSIADQEQGLLGGKEGRGSEYSRDRATIIRKPWRWRLCLGIGGTALLVMVISIWFARNLSHNVTDAVAKASSIQTNDYILDQDWDFDAPPRRREYTWTVRDQVHNPDGVYRPMMLVNDQFPGPLIEVNEGDTIVVHVDNRAVNATSLHWHGIYQNGTPHMDGTVGITQCPIAPGGKFTYEFTLTKACSHPMACTAQW